MPEQGKCLNKTILLVRNMHVEGTQMNKHMFADIVTIA